MLLCPAIKVSGKLQQPPPGRRTKGTDPVTPSGKRPRPVEVFTEGRGNREWIVEGSYKYQSRPDDQLQKQ